MVCITTTASLVCLLARATRTRPTTLETAASDTGVETKRTITLGNWDRCFEIQFLESIFQCLSYTHTTPAPPKYNVQFTVHLFKIPRGRYHS